MKRQLLLFCLMSAFANSVLAWDGYVSGKIGIVEVTGPGNYSFRIWLQGYAALCGNGNAWAYLDDSDGNYKTYVAALLSAKALGETITLYTTRDANGYCRIGHLGIVAS